MIMDVIGPEPIYEETAPYYVPYIIIGVLLVICIALTIYMVKRSKGDKNEKKNK